MRYWVIFQAVAISCLCQCVALWMRPQNSKHLKSSLRMALELKTLQIPVQRQFSNYENIVNSQFGERNVLRWYIASIDNNHALIEAVIENSIADTTTQVELESCPKPLAK